MKLYDVARAPNCRRVHLFAAEKGLTIPRVPVDYDGRGYASAAYREKVNPFALVPALELDDGQVLCESVAICRYLEHLQPEPNLMGRDPMESIRIEMWNRHAELGLFLWVSQTFRHHHSYMKTHEVPQVPAWGHRPGTRRLQRYPYSTRPCRHAPTSQQAKDQRSPT